MAKLGSGEYPELTFSQALTAIEGIKKDNIRTIDGLSKLLGHESTKSGPFTQKVAALNKFYGLIEQVRTDIKLAPLGSRIAYPVSDSDREEACRESINRIGLFRDLFTALGANFSPNDFRPKLRDITSADNAEVAKRGPYLERAYQDVVRIMRPQAPGGKPSDAPSPAEGAGAATSNLPPPPPRQNLPPPPEGNPDDYWVFNAGDSYFRIKKNLAALKSAEAVIKALIAMQGPE